MAERGGPAVSVLQACLCQDLQGQTLTVTLSPQAGRLVCLPWRRQGQVPAKAMNFSQKLNKNLMGNQEGLENRSPHLREQFLRTQSFPPFFCDQLCQNERRQDRGASFSGHAGNAWAPGREATSHYTCTVGPHLPTAQFPKPWEWVLHLFFVKLCFPNDCFSYYPLKINLICFGLAQPFSPRYLIQGCLRFSTSDFFPSEKFLHNCGYKCI